MFQSQKCNFASFNIKSPLNHITTIHFLNHLDLDFHFKASFYHNIQFCGNRGHTDIACAPSKNAKNTSKQHEFNLSLAKNKNFPILHTYTTFTNLVCSNKYKKCSNFRRQNFPQHPMTCTKVKVELFKVSHILRGL